jgi:3-phytase
LHRWTTWARAVTWLSALALALVATACEGDRIDDPAADAPVVHAVAETEPVPHHEDAADDPAIWVHPDEPTRSLVIATDKTDAGALIVYDLDGAEIHRQPGSYNNVEIAYGFVLDGRETDLAVSSDREHRAIAAHAIDPATGRLDDVAVSEIPVPFEPYGVCLYAPDDGRLYAFATAHDEGILQQWELFDDGTGRLDGRHVRDLQLDSQAEGCVVDDERAHLYVGEEEVGILRYDATPEGSSEADILDRVIQEGGDHLVADVEGLALYLDGRGGRYLLASSQGNDSFVVYEVEPFRYAGTFRVSFGQDDPVTHTDGIDVVSVPLGDEFRGGLFVAQDDSEGRHQNFKLVSWAEIAETLGLDETASW